MAITTVSVPPHATTSGTSTAAKRSPTDLHAAAITKIQLRSQFTGLLGQGFTRTSDHRPPPERSSPKPKVQRPDFLRVPSIVDRLPWKLSIARGWQTVLIEPVLAIANSADFGFDPIPHGGREALRGLLLPPPPHPADWPPLHCLDRIALCPKTRSQYFPYRVHQ